MLKNLIHMDNVINLTPTILIYKDKSLKGKLVNKNIRQNLTYFPGTSLLLQVSQVSHFFNVVNFPTNHYCALFWMKICIRQITTYHLINKRFTDCIPRTGWLSHAFTNFTMFELIIYW